MKDYRRVTSTVFAYTQLQQYCRVLYKMNKLRAYNKFKFLC